MAIAKNIEFYLTLNGAMTVAVGAYTDFYVTLTSLTAAVLQRIGSGTL
jgi:hypothetical protein